MVSCYSYVDAGAYEEEDGITGVAHLLEHMAFKGTDRIGTSDHTREAPLLQALDETFYALRDARRAGRAADVERLSGLMAQLQAQADPLSEPNAFGLLLEQNGAVGLNAQTSQDSTVFYVSLPRNKLPLWFALESDRFQQPVFRGLYREKEVVLEERKLRVDNPPLGKFQETFALKAFASNYRRPVIGFERDIQDLGTREVAEFHRQELLELVSGGWEGGSATASVSLGGNNRPARRSRSPMHEQAQLQPESGGHWHRG